MLIKKKYEKNLNRKILTKFNSLKNSIKKEPRKILKRGILENRTRKRKLKKKRKKKYFDSCKFKRNSKILKLEEIESTSFLIFNLILSKKNHKDRLQRKNFNKKKKKDSNKTTRNFNKNCFIESSFQRDIFNIQYSIFSSSNNYVDR